MVTVAAVSTIPEERWSTTPIARIMHRVPMPVLTPECSVSEALDILAGATFAQLPVVRDGWVTGDVWKERYRALSMVARQVGLPGSRLGERTRPITQAKSPITSVAIALTVGRPLDLELS